jgi:tellurite resistance protein TehA-like permease
VLFVSAPLLGLGLVALHHPPLRRIPVLVAAVAVASVGAASFPETAPLVALAGLPGAGLLLLAAGLQAIAAKNASPRSVQAAPSASSLTHIAPQPSLIISPAMRLSRSEGSAAEGGEP